MHARLAPLMLLLSVAPACGGGETADAGTDVPPSDTFGTLDTPVVLDAPDAADPTTTTLTVYDPETGEPDANESVLFFDADGTFVEEVMTGTDGVARGTIDAGGSVVLMARNDADALPYDPVVYVGARPGDTLVFRRVNDLPFDSVDVTVPTAPTAMTYQMSSSCDGSVYVDVDRPTTTQRVAVPRCAGANILVTARTATGVVGALTATGVDSTAGTLNLPGPYVPVTALEVTAMNIAPTAAMIDLSAGYVFDDAFQGGFGTSGVPSAGRFTTTGMFAGAPGIELRIGARLTRAGYLGIENYLIEPYAADVLVDLTSLAMPFIQSPAYAVAAHEVTWTEDGAGQVDVVTIALDFRRGGVTYTWFGHAAPEGATRVALPTLPAPWTDYNPIATDEQGNTIFFYRMPGFDRAMLADPGTFDRTVSLAGTERAAAFTRTFLP